MTPDKLVTPDDVQGRYPTLRDAVLADNWPTLAASRGRFVFALDESPAKVAAYRGARASLEGRVFFVNTDEASPAAAYLTLNDPVRDAARIHDTRPRDAALASGAQYVSTDYLWPDPRFAGGYRVRLPGGAVTRCNPVRRPAGCGDPETAR